MTIFKIKHTPRSSLIKISVEKTHYRWHIASIAFPLNVAEASLVKQADCQPRNFMNTGTISERVFWKNQNWPNIPMKVTGCAEMRPGF
jgi:hypothetical protein